MPNATQSSPAISERPAQSYCAIVLHCRRDEIGAKVPPLLEELLKWFEQHGVTPAGPQVIRYQVVDYNTGNLDIEVGLIAKSDKRPENKRIHWSEIPAGRYVTVVHAGSYDTLVDSTAELLARSRANRMPLDVEEHDHVTRWGCRVESYLVAPPQEQQTERWRTEIAILLSNAGADRTTTINKPLHATEKETP